MPLAKSRRCRATIFALSPQTNDTMGAGESITFKPMLRSFTRRYCVVADRFVRRAGCFVTYSRLAAAAAADRGEPAQARRRLCAARNKRALRAMRLRQRRSHHRDFLNAAKLSG